MIIKVLHSTNHRILNKMVDNFKPGSPVYDHWKQRLGTIVSMRRTGDWLEVDAEVVPEDFARKFAASLSTDGSVCIE